MPSYTLEYFNVKGRAENSRMLFAMGGQKFEDVRVKAENWKDHQKTTPFGGLPVLKIDGKPFCQARAIERYLANKFGLYGKTPEDQLKTDQVIDCLADFNELAVNIRWAPSEEEKAKRLEVYNSEKAPDNMAKLEKMVGDKGVFVGDQISWADISLYNVLDHALGVDNVKIDLDKTPKLKALHKKVETHPKIAEWIKTRPQGFY